MKLGDTGRIDHKYRKGLVIHAGDLTDVKMPNNMDACVSIARVLYTEWRLHGGAGDRGNCRDKSSILAMRRHTCSAQ